MKEFSRGSEQSSRTIILDKYYNLGQITSFLIQQWPVSVCLSEEHGICLEMTIFSNVRKSVQIKHQAIKTICTVLYDFAMKYFTDTIKIVGQSRNC